jgi:hypothetical protein
MRDNPSSKANSRNTRSSVADIPGREFESLFSRLGEGAALEQLAYRGLLQSWQEGHQLPDSVPEFLDWPKDFTVPEQNSSSQWRFRQCCQ